MRVRFIALLILILVVAALPSFAHQGHDKKEEEESTRTESPETVKPEAKEEEMTAKGGEPLPPLSEQLMSHPHNKIVHFPVGFGLAGALFAFISLKKPEMLTAVRILWLLAALAAVGAYFTGEAQEEPFEDGPLHDVVELHEKLGTATGICLGVGFLLSLSRKMLRVTVFWSIVLVALISVTGFYGGILGHS